MDIRKLDLAIQTSQWQNNARLTTLAGLRLANNNAPLEPLL